MVEIEELSGADGEATPSTLRQRTNVGGGDASSATGVVDLSDGRGELLKKIVKEAPADAPLCGARRAAVHYTGKFQDGRVFDSSVSRGQPLVFNVGSGSVIRGWDEAVKSMRVGEKCVLTCAPSYAYGSRGAGAVIPPDTTLIFEMELVEVVESGPINAQTLFLIVSLFFLVYFMYTMQKKAPPASKL